MASERARALEQLWPDASAVVLRAGFWARPPGWAMRDSVRRHGEVWLVTRGGLALDLGGRPLTAERGAALVIPPGVPHRAVNARPEALRFHALHCVVRVLGAAAPDVFGAFPPLLRPREAPWRELLAGAEQIESELAVGEPGAALIANAAMARLLGILWREAARTSAAPPPAGAAAPGTAAWPPGLGAAGGDPRLARVLIHIAEHLVEPLTVARLASVVNLSPAHFSGMFRRATGLSPMQYVQRARWQRARNMLANSAAGVADVARAVGVQDPFYFSRAFKRWEGVSPLQYRRARRRTDVP